MQNSIPKFIFVHKLLFTNVKIHLQNATQVFSPVWVKWSNQPLHQTCVFENCLNYFPFFTNMMKHCCIENYFEKLFVFFLSSVSMCAFKKSMSVWAVILTPSETRPLYNWKTHPKISYYLCFFSCFNRWGRLEFTSARSCTVFISFFSEKNGWKLDRHIYGCLFHFILLMKYLLNEAERLMPLDLGTDICQPWKI